MAFPFKPPVRRDGGIADAGVPSTFYRPGRGKKANLKDAETGRQFGMTSCSANSPTFFQCPMQDNLDYFEKCSAVEHLTNNRSDPKNLKPRAAGFHSVEEAKRATDFVGQKSHGTIEALTGKVWQPTACSPDGPGWFTHVFDANRQELEEHGLSKGWFGGNATDIHHLKQRKAHGMSCEETGRIGSHVVSKQSPDWMKSSLEANRQYLEDNGHSVPVRSQIQCDHFNEHPHGKKPIFAISPESGHSIHAQIVSASSPRWMRSPILCNKDFFEKVSNRKLEETNKQVRERHGKRHHTRDPDTGEIVKCRANTVSVDAIPDWMLPSKSLPPDQFRSGGGGGGNAAASGSPGGRSHKSASQPATARRSADPRRREDQRAARPAQQEKVRQGSESKVRPQTARARREVSKSTPQSRPETARPRHESTRGNTDHRQKYGPELQRGSRSKR